jgi:hypothetical protein
VLKLYLYEFVVYLALVSVLVLADTLNTRKPGFNVSPRTGSNAVLKRKIDGFGKVRKYVNDIIDCRVHRRFRRDTANISNVEVRAFHLAYKIGTGGIGPELSSLPGPSDPVLLPCATVGVVTVVR